MFGPKNPVTLEPPAPAMPVSGMPGGPGMGEGGDVHLLDRLSVVYRYRRVAISVIILVLVAGAVQTYTTTPQYEAMGTVQIEQNPGSITGMQSDASSDSMEYFRTTENAILGSRELALKVVRRLNLAENPIFNGTAQRRSGLGATLSLIQARITKPLRSIFTGTAILQDTPGATDKGAMAADTSGTQAAKAPAETPAEAQAVSAFMQRLKVLPQLNSNLVNIKFTDSPDPRMAATAANTLINVYVEQNLAHKRKKADDEVAAYEAQVKAARDHLDADSETVLAYQSNSKSAAMLDPAVMQQQVNTAQAQLDLASSAKTKAQQKYDRLKALDLDSEAALRDPDISKDPEVSSLRRTIDALNADYNNQIAGGLGPSNAKVKAIQSQIEQEKKLLKEAMQNIVAGAANDLQFAIQDEKTWQTRFDVKNATAGVMGHEGVTYSVLLSNKTRDEATFDDFSKKLAAAKIDQSSVENNVSMMDQAVTPASPFKPIHANDLLIAFFVGLALAVILSFGLDYLDDTIKTPEDITRKLHIPFLGLVPSVRGERQPVLSGPVPHDFGEAYRALRTSLVFTSGGESTRVITVTSAQPLEGKTTTACNVAMVLAFGGSRVLLIDADMRRPGIHKALKINNTVGLSHLLVGQARVREAIQRTSDPNFCVMTAGRTPPNPSELLSSERMKQLVLNLKQGPFDWVVIDTPPVLAVTDAIILTPLVDCVTFVLGAEMTRRRLAERAVHMLMSSRPKIIGAVLNRVNFDRNKYYYSRYYGYQYKSYYGTGTGSAPNPPQD